MAGDLFLPILGQPVALASTAVADEMMDALRAVSATTLTGVAILFWMQAGDVTGLRLWFKRLAYQSQFGDELDFVRDEHPTLYKVVSAEQLCRSYAARTLTLLVALILLLSFSQVYCWMKKGTDQGGWQAWLFCGSFFALLVGLYSATALVLAAARFGRPNQERDRSYVEKLGQKLQSPCRELAHEIAETLQASPEFVRSAIKNRMSERIRHFAPKTFKLEREYMLHLCGRLSLISSHSDRSKVDVLALCTEETLGADHIAKYWEANRHAAAQGVYISRIFVYDDSNREQVEAAAKAQSLTRVRAYLVSRAALASVMKQSYGLPVFGFTVIAGVDELTEAVVHDGLGDSVVSASYASIELVQYLAGLHHAIREKASSMRASRAARVVDEQRLPIRLKGSAGTLDAMRLDFSEGPQLALSVATRFNPLGKLTRPRADNHLQLTSVALKLDQHPMQIVHAHAVDHTVCRRREHKICMQARQGDYVVGLREVGPEPPPNGT